jgi:hypothetical protein
MISPRFGAAASLLFGVGVVLVGPTSTAHADTPTPITDCTDATAVDAAVAAGGDYEFTCTGTITVGALTVTKDVSLDANGNYVQLFGGAGTSTFDVQSGTLSLTGILITGGRPAAARRQSPAPPGPTARLDRPAQPERMASPRAAARPPELTAVPVEPAPPEPTAGSAPAPRASPRVAASTSPRARRPRSTT